MFVLVRSAMTNHGELGNRKIVQSHQLTLPLGRDSVVSFLTQDCNGRQEVPFVERRANADRREILLRTLVNENGVKSES
jgi:hypothetical protein